ncbi:MAG: transposase [Candidatus Magasanikbacteria bacterium]|nr:transposase [Candidatus Magasanikbacteria bacterium]
MRKTFTPNQKAQVALSALAGTQSVSQIASAYEVHPTQVKQWAGIAKEGLPLLFTDKRKNEHKDLEDKLDQLFRIIGQRDVELDWLKKKLHLDTP